MKLLLLIISIILCIERCWSWFGSPSGPTDCRYSVTGFEYVGMKDTTISGRKCQAWVSNFPHSHANHNANFPDGTQLEAKNYCRNPDNETILKDPLGGGPAGPWCYTTDPEVRWEYCGIPYCRDSGKPDPKTCSKGRCGNSCTSKGLECCFCDETRTLNLEACFCCPKNHSCCPVETWTNNEAHCCPEGYACTKDLKCTKQLNIKPTPAEGMCGFNCREDTKIYVTVDDAFNIYIDGVYQSLKNANNWKVADLIDVKADAKVITICGQNSFYKAGMLIHSLDPKVIENAVWKCYNSTRLCSSDWSLPTFNDEFWGNPVDDEKNDGKGNRTEIVYGIPENTNYKWCNNPGTLLTKDWVPDCTCRLTLRKYNGY